MSGILIAWRIERRMTAVLEISCVAEQQHHWQVFDDQGGCCGLSRGCLVAEAMNAACEAAQSSPKVLTALKNHAAEAVSPPEEFNPSDCADCQYHHKHFADEFAKSGHCYLLNEVPSNRCSQKLSMNSALGRLVFDPMWTGNGVS